MIDPVTRQSGGGFYLFHYFYFARVCVCVCWALDGTEKVDAWWRVGEGAGRVDLDRAVGDTKGTHREQRSLADH